MVRPVVSLTSTRGAINICLPTNWKIGSESPGCICGFLIKTKAREEIISIDHSAAFFYRMLIFLRTLI